MERRIRWWIFLALLVLGAASARRVEQQDIPLDQYENQQEAYDAQEEAAAMESASQNNQQTTEEETEEQYSPEAQNGQEMAGSPGNHHHRFRGFFKSLGKGIAKVGKVVGKVAKGALNLVKGLFGHKDKHQDPAKDPETPPVRHTPPPPDLPEPKPRNLFHFRKQDIEDCIACQYVWFQVEQEIGDDHMEDNIYDAFTQTCIDAQKAAIFYPACEHMFDEVYDMIGDYMEGKHNVNQMCIAAGFCRDPYPPFIPEPTLGPYVPPTFPPMVIPHIPMPPPPKPTRPPHKPPRPQPTLPPIIDPFLKQFLVTLHFENGFELYRLFDYAQKSRQKDRVVPGKGRPRNPNGFHEEHLIFPQEFRRLKEQLPEGYFMKQGVHLYLGGYASAVGDNQRNMVLSEKRAQAVACYLRELLFNMGYSDFSFTIGYFGRELSTGQTEEAQSMDRKVLVFFKQSDLRPLMKAHRNKGNTGFLVWRSGSNEMKSYCANTKAWQNKKWEDSYVRPILKD